MAAHEKPVLPLVVDQQEEVPSIDSFIPSQDGAAPGVEALARQVPATSSYLLEMARTFSIDCQSEPVLCTQFIPGVDLLVSADSWSQTFSTPAALQSRLDEVNDVVEATMAELPSREEWCTAVLSFGLVRWWSARMRERVASSLGPFKVVIDCQRSMVQIDGTWIDGSRGEPSGHDGTSCKPASTINGH